MSLKKTTHRGHSTMSELNITPLLDLVFVLLVIFIITTPQMVNNLEMTLPSAHQPPPKTDAPKPKINRIVVDETGRVFLNNEFVANDALKSKLQGLKTENPDPMVVVKGADEVNYQSMITVLDALQQLDITKVGLATQ